MKQLFNPDGPVMVVLQAISDLFLINLCFLVSCVPIFTIGTAVTAMYGIYFRKEKDGSVIKAFFSKFRQNFKQSTVVWLILLLLGLILLMDFRLLAMVDGSYAIVSYILYFACFALVGVCCYVFPMIARFENSTVLTVKNALLLSIYKFPKTILMVAITILPLIFLIMSTDLFAKIFMVWLLIGFAGSAKVNSMILTTVFADLKTADE